ncbi:proteasome assembly chaperone family protein [Natronococcus wangiae]|uniref:proteasome assembly chaperone family protein n=1 Tax=Natronococcus wangiae TaxID=3068275 RepID=UPI00273EAC71|nr:PAC2 family protein [Natronococcus sp. AD5]
MASEPRYEVSVSSDDSLEGTLVVGLSNVGLAGLTAVDHLIHQLEFERIGHVRARNFPTITPFANGTPRQAVRLYAAPEHDCCVLASEFVVPVWAAPTFADAVQNLVASSDIEEITIFHGVPVPHGPDEHALFYVATPEYRERRLDDAGIAPLRGGVLDGVPGEFANRSLIGELPPLGALITPIHPPGPDFEAALRFLAFLREGYGLAVEDEQLRERSEAMNRYYSELADRIETLESEGIAPEDRNRPVDRMFM